MRKAIATLLMSGSVLAGSAWAQEGDPDVGAILDCVANAVPSDVVILQQLRFVTTQPGDEAPSELDARLYLTVSGRAGEGAGRHLDAMMRVDAPEFLAGASYLLREASDADGSDGMYVYLPSVRRVRRVSGGFGDTALMGTEFSYNTFRRWQGLFGDADVTFVDTTERQGRRTHNLLLEAPHPERAVHDRIEVSIDAEQCLVMEAEFYDGSRLHKRLSVEAEDLRQFGQYWYPYRLRMADLRDGGESVLKVQRIRVLSDPNEGVFDPGRFHRVP